MSRNIPLKRLPHRLLPTTRLEKALTDECVVRVIRDNHVCCEDRERQEGFAHGTGTGEEEVFGERENTSPSSCVLSHSYI